MPRNAAVATFPRAITRGLPSFQRRSLMFKDLWSKVSALMSAISCS